jgi:hypothetical protein
MAATERGVTKPYRCAPQEGGDKLRRSGNIVRSTPMLRFRVFLRGAPVFLTNEETQQTERLGFSTTRWVRARTAETAGVLACRWVLAELEELRPKNPAGERIAVTVDEVSRVSWFRAPRLGRGRGFSFFPDEGGK